MNPNQEAPLRDTVVFFRLSKFDQILRDLTVMMLTSGVILAGYLWYDKFVRSKLFMWLGVWIMIIGIVMTVLAFKKLITAKKRGRGKVRFSAEREAIILHYSRMRFNKKISFKSLSKITLQDDGLLLTRKNGSTYYIDFGKSSSKDSRIYKVHNWLQKSAYSNIYNSNGADFENYEAVKNYR